MQIIRHPIDCHDALKGSVLALGNFDGVHRGHQIIVEKALEIARDTSKPAAVMTFEPHPAAVLKMGKEPIRITPFRQKTRLIEQAGVDALFVMHFTRKFSRITAENFIQGILHKQLQVSHIVIGDDFHFGYKRGGNAAMLDEMANANGYALTQLADINDEAGRFSSSRIRECLKDGDIPEANTLLGHDYLLQGRVRAGEQRGTDLLDCPTANILPKDHLPPRFGVYIAEAQLEKEKNWRPAITHIGLNSTFGGQKAVVETHIFNFNADIYGERLKVKPLRFLRQEEQFDSVDGLKDAMKKDIALAKEHFGL